MDALNGSSPRTQTRTGAVPYLPGLDGLRALSVIAVLLFHSALGWPGGGFLGVEVFFVISGYIITATLLAEHAATGRISRLQFWRRRARRLLPALIALLAGVLAYASLLDRDLLPSLRVDALGAATYVTNWQLIFGSEPYFSSFGQPSLLKHLWSLAVEEQFYIVWPLIVAGGLAFVRPARLGWLVLAGAVAGFVFVVALSLSGASFDRLYYGTDTRAPGLLLGSALAFGLAPGGTWRRNWLADVAGVAGIGVLVALVVLAGEGESWLFRGGMAVVDVAAVLLIVSVVTGSVAPRVLGVARLQWMGKRSYGIYLWHWPVMVITAHASWLSVSDGVLAFLQLIASIAFAEVSYRLVEAPVRAGALGRAWERRAEWRALHPARQLATVSGAVGSLALVGVLGLSVFGASGPAQPAYFATNSVRVVGPASVGGAKPSFPLRATPTPAPLIVPSAEETVLPEIMPQYVAEPEPETPVPAQVPATEEPATAPPPPAPPPPPPPPPPPVVAARVTAIGDSVMLGAAYELAGTGAGVDVDAAVGRHVSSAISTLRQRAASGGLGDIVLLHIGNNGVLRASDIDAIVEIAGDRRIVFVNLRVPRDWEEGNNAALAEGAARYSNVSVVDWHGFTAAEPGVLWTDGTHLNGGAAWSYVGLIAPYIT